MIRSKVFTKPYTKAITRPVFIDVKRAHPTAGSF